MHVKYKYFHSYSQGKFTTHRNYVDQFNTIVPMFNWVNTMDVSFRRRDRIPLQTQNFSKEERKDSSRNRDSQNPSPDGFEPETFGSIVQCSTTEPTTAAAEPASNLCYLRNKIINVYCS